MAAVRVNELKKVASTLADRLRANSLGAPLRIQVCKPGETDTGGWAVKIGSLGPDRPEIDVWYDKWLDGASPVFWAGFWGTPATVRKLIDDCPTNMYASIEIGQNSATTTKMVDHLTIEASRRILKNVPIKEFYDDNELACFGVYSGIDETLDIAKSEMFIIGVLKVLAEFGDDGDVYSGFENRKVVIRHLRAERKSALALKRKRMDNYRCTVCDRRFEEEYGPLGKGFAEAHHIVPLSTLKHEVQTYLKDLRTVCSNCHRMLHKMKGEGDDIKTLREIWAEHHPESPLFTLREASAKSLSSSSSPLHSDDSYS